MDDTQNTPDTTGVEQAEQAERPSFARRIVTLLGRVLIFGVLVLMVLWAAAALYYSTLPSSLRTLAAVIMIAGGLWASLRRKHRWPTRLVLLVVWLGVVGYWTTIAASNDREWMADVAVLATVAFDGDQVTIDNMRNCTYRSASDYTPAYDRRQYDLSKLRSVGLVVSYFSSLQDIAHTFLTFGFSDGQHLPVSIEVRKEQGETYSPITGLFKQFEIIYIVGDERDLIGSRTTYRDEDVYLYPMDLNGDEMRVLLVDMLEEVDRLAQQPQFYNTIYPNCTTSIVHHVRKVMPGRARLDIRMLLNGFSDQMVYERGSIVTDLPFEEARQRFRINAVAREAEGAPDFSKQIRQAWPADLR